MTTVSNMRQRLRDRRGEWPDIAEKAGLSYWWLIKLAQGKIAEPGLHKVERLQTELDARDKAEQERAAPCA